MIDEAKEEMRLVRDLLHRGVERHEREEHDGELCVVERINRIAFVAHCLGFTALGDGDEEILATARDLDARVRDYAAVHSEQHVHDEDSHAEPH